MKAGRESMYWYLYLLEQKRRKGNSNQHRINQVQRDCEDVVIERNLNAAYSLSQAKEQQIYVPCREAQRLQLVSVAWCIQLI